MNADTSNSTRETEQEPKPSEIAPSLAPKDRRAFSKLRRELSDEELSSPGVQKLLLDAMDRLEQENLAAKDVSLDYHKKDKQCAILEERLKQNNAMEVLYSVSLTMGAGLVGLAPSAWSSQPTGWLLVIFGALLILGAVIAKLRSR